MREIPIYMKHFTPQCDPHVAGLARDLVTGFRDLLSDLLEVSPNELHCCLKVLVEGKDGEDRVVTRVVTLARSTPENSHYDDNEIEGCKHFVSNNSDWAALMGEDDGKTRWPLPFPCFSCNDLTAHMSTYRCSRENWSQSYNSTLAFPVRYVTNPKNNRYNTIGFIVFYSKMKDAFPGFPDIYHFVEQSDKYYDVLSSNTAFQMAACLVDILSITLRPIYEQKLNQP
jgi:hypothetical protein